MLLLLGFVFFRFENLVMGTVGSTRAVLLLFLVGECFFGI
jgi:hypothetical protein